MKGGPLLAGVCVTAAAALAVVVGSVTDSRDAPAVNDDAVITFPDGRVDGWANPDVDIGTVAAREHRAQQEPRACGTANSSAPTPAQHVSPEPLTAAANADAVNPFPGSRVDGWANRDVDIGAFAR